VCSHSGEHVEVVLLLAPQDASTEKKIERLVQDPVDLATLADLAVLARHPLAQDADSVLLVVCPDRSVAAMSGRSHDAVLRPADHLTEGRLALLGTGSPLAVAVAELLVRADFSVCVSQRLHLPNSCPTSFSAVPRIPWIF